MNVYSTINLGAFGFNRDGNKGSHGLCTSIGIGYDDGLNTGTKVHYIGGLDTGSGVDYGGRLDNINGFDSYNGDEEEVITQVTQSSNYLRDVILLTWGNNILP